MKKLNEIFNKFKTKALMFATVATVSVLGVIASAEEASPAPLISSSDLSILTGFGTSVKNAVPILLAVTVPIGLGIWILPTAINKGINMMKGAIAKLKVG